MSDFTPSDEQTKYIINLQQELQAKLDERARLFEEKMGQEGQEVDGFEETYSMIADTMLLLSRTYIGLRRLEDAVREELRNDVQDPS